VADKSVAAFDKSTVFDAAIAAEIPKPPGELWETFDVDGQTYEVWKGTLDEIPIQQVVRRIQILVPFFIEGGTCIDMRENEETLERWSVFFLYQKKTIDVDPRASPYVFMGYSTVYRYFYYQPLSSPRGKKQRISHEANLDFTLPLLEKRSFTEYPCRSRISQFVILPPFQGGGNGSRFYNSIFDFYLKDPSTLEITVEDPNEAFDDLRDVNDLARLRTRIDFSGLRINTKAAIRAKGAVPNDILDPEELEKIRKSIKIAPRQFARVIEMQLLSLIPSGVRASLIIERPNATVPDLKLRQHEYHLWQLLVKNRLYRHNKDQLIQLDRTERIEKLEQALGSVEADYGRLLRALDRRVNGDISENGKTHSNGKRSSPDDEATDHGEPASKKVKFA
jgi:histone acetyltransferase 1